MCPWSRVLISLSGAVYICKTLAVLALVPLFLTACGGRVEAPVVSPGNQQRGTYSRNINVRKPDVYLVRRGDTLYSIAWNYNLDYKDLSRWNGIRAPYTIYPGQKIRLKPRPSQRQRTTQKQDRPQPKKPASADTSKSQKSKQVQKRPAQKQPVGRGPVKWHWPTPGKIIKSDTPISKNGIDISGKLNQRINASADGVVVYSGSGLLGYGKLIIIKHDEVYLSAYAHNSRLLVKEGQRVAAGQHIAYMGKTSNGRVLLHFEIRKNGQPDSPLKYLPLR